MRLFQGLTYEQVLDLPAAFAVHALAWDGVEREVQAELEQEAADKAGR